MGADPDGAAFNPASMTLFAAWSSIGGGDDGNFIEAQRNARRRKIAAGAVLFNTVPVQISNVRGLNDNAVLGKPSTFTGNCTTCHDTPNVGNHSFPLPLDIGTSHSMLPSVESDPNILEVRGGRRGVCLARNDLIADPAPEIELVADGAAERVVVVVGWRGGTPQRCIDRFAYAFRAGAQSQCGKKAGVRLSGERPRLRIIGQRGGESRVPCDQLLLESVEFHAVVERPPAVARQAVGGLCLSPRSHLLIGNRSGSLRRFKGRRQRAGTEQQRERRAGPGCELSLFHRDASPGQGIWYGVVWNEGVPSLVLTSSGEPVDEVTAVSGNGSLIGGALFDGQLPLGDGYRRHARGGAMQFVQPLPGDAAPAQPFAMSRDGTVMVGFSGNPFLSFNPGPFIWTRNMGTMNLDEFVRGQGTAMEQWVSLWEPSAVSDDGRTIGGWGVGFLAAAGWVLQIDTAFVCHHPVSKAGTMHAGVTSSVEFPNEFDERLAAGDTVGRCP